MDKIGEKPPGIVGGDIEEKRGEEMSAVDRAADVFKGEASESIRLLEPQKIHVLSGPHADFLSRFSDPSTAKDILERASLADEFIATGGAGGAKSARLQASPLSEAFAPIREEVLSDMAKNLSGAKSSEDVYQAVAPYLELALAHDDGDLCWEFVALLCEKYGDNKGDPQLSARRLVDQLFSLYAKAKGPYSLRVIREFLREHGQEVLPKYEKYPTAHGATITSAIEQADRETDVIFANQLLEKYEKGEGFEAIAADSPALREMLNSEFSEYRWAARAYILSMAEKYGWTSGNDALFDALRAGVSFGQDPEGTKALGDTIWDATTSGDSSRKLTNISHWPSFISACQAFNWIVGHRDIIKEKFKRDLDDPDLKITLEHQAGMTEAPAHFRGDFESYRGSARQLLNIYKEALAERS